MKRCMYLLYKHQWNSKWAVVRKLRIFTHENTLLPSHMNRSPSLWLHNKSHLFTGVYIVNRILHARMWIWISSSCVQLDISWVSTSSWTLQDNIHIHARACNIYANPRSRWAATLPCCRSLVPRVSVVAERPWEWGCCCPSSHTIISCLLIFSVPLPLVI